MKKTSTYGKLLLLLFVMLIISQNKTFAQAHDPSRGLYIDGFATVDADDSLVPAFSILNQQSKEDSLLRYCEENHITYIILYNLSQVLDNDTTNNTYKETALCNFMHKAKTLYGITKIGAIVGSENGVRRDSIFQFRQMYPTPAFKFTNAEKTSSSYNLLKFVETAYTSSDSLFEVSELTKSALNVSHFNKVAATCASPYNEKFDVINLELEFWNQLSPNQYNTTEKKILDAMARLRFLNDSIFPTSPILTEIYLGYLNKFTTPDSNAIASYLDGQLYSNGDTVKLNASKHRLLDRFLLAYYSSDPTTSYIQNRYKNRLHTFDKSFTLPQSNTIPLFSAATIALGYDGDFFGKWFPKSNRNNIFVAEKNWYSSWLGDIGHPSVPQKNITEPGQAAWFTSSIMSNEITSSKIKHTNTFYSDSPVNTYGASSATVNFTYIGPIEQNAIIHFKLDSAGTILYSKDTVTVNSSSSIYIPSLGSKNLKPYIYTGILQMDYGNGHIYTYREPVIVFNGVQAQAMGNTTFCDGSGVILKSGKRQGSNAVMRYHWFKDSIPLYNDSTLAYYYATLGGNYYCRVDSTNSSGVAPKFTNTLSVTILSNDPVVIAESNFTYGASRTLTANGTHVTGTTYAWNNGATTRAMNITNYDTYEVIVTQPSGCFRKASLDIPLVQCTGSKYFDYEVKSTNHNATNFTVSAFNDTDSVAVHVDFHINKNFTFHGAYMVFDPNVKVIVDSSFTLTINDTAELRACSYMWQGIEVKKGATLNINSTSKINDATTGIQVDSGGVVHALNSFFDNNFKSITFDSDNFNSSSVIGCSFSCTSGYGLKEPFKYLRTQTHIELNYVALSILTQGITIGSTSGSPNYFSGSDFGLLFENSSLKIYNSVFSNYTQNTAIPSFGGGVAISGGWSDRPSKPVDLAKNIIGGTATNQRNYFNNCESGIEIFAADFKASSNTFSGTKKAIYSNAILKRAQIEVDNNTIQNTDIGIDIVASSSPDINIHDNPTISVNPTSASTTQTVGIRVAKSFSSSAKVIVENNPNISGKPTYGIFVSGFDTSKISNNKIFMNHVGLTSEVFGIRVENCKGPVINCNYVRGDSTLHIANKNGISVSMSQHSFVDNNTTRNTNKGFEFLGDCDRSTIRGNTMKYHLFGLALGDSLGSTSWSSGIIGDQDTLNGLTLGNRFEGQDSAGTFSGGAALLSINSDAAAKTFWVNTAYFPPTSFRAIRAAGYTGILTNFFPTDHGYTHYSIPASCVFANRPSKGGGILEECCLDDEPLDEPEEIINNSRSRGAYEDILEEASSLTEPEQAFSDSISVTNAGALTEVEMIIKSADKKLLEGNNAEYLAKLADAESRNSDVSNTTIFEENEKILNSILIDKKDGTSSEFTESERNSIEYIAFQCPYRGGKAVFKARPLVYTWNREIKFDDNLLCEGSSSFRKAPAKNKPEKAIRNNFIKFYPIPTDGELYADYKLSLYQDAKIVVINLLGEIIFLQSINCKTNSAKINLSDLEPSIYFVKVIADEKPIDQAKITILK